MTTNPRRARQKGRRITTQAARALRETRDPATAVAVLLAGELRRTPPARRPAVASEALRTEHPATVVLGLELCEATP